MHTSGRNSGVLHAGFYYKTDSQKAKFCRQGNQAWTEFCLLNDIPIRYTGKIVACKSEHEVQSMYELYEQGLKNGVELQLISLKKAREMEPTLVGHGKECIYSPSTKVMNTKIALQTLRSEV